MKININDYPEPFKTTLAFAIENGIAEIGELRGEDLALVVDGVFIHVMIAVMIARIAGVDVHAMLDAAERVAALRGEIEIPEDLKASAREVLIANVVGPLATAEKIAEGRSA